MLGWRLGISCVLVPVLFLLFRFDHQSGEPAWILLGLSLLLICRSTYELKLLLTKRAMQPTYLVPTLAACFILLAGWLPHLNLIRFENSIDSLAMIGFASSLAIMAVFLNRAFRFEKPGTSMESVGAELIMVLYIGFLFAVTTQLRWVAGAEMGYLAIGSMIVTAKGGDIGAYFLGRFFGKTKLAPKLSPGKTRMGAFGALLGGAVCAVLWFKIATPFFNPNWSPAGMGYLVLYGVIVALAGLLGDLCESLIKRDIEQKDSAALMPGFGGLLDLLDSILFAGPVALILWLLLPLISQAG